MRDGIFRKMNDLDIRNFKRLASEEVLPRLVRALAVGSGACGEPLDVLYPRVVGDFIRELLSAHATAECSPEVHCLGETCLGNPSQFDPLEPQVIGRLYEYLRGFRLHVERDKEPRLVPSSTSKRNQGLFYTPPKIVNYIVAQVLDALEISRPSDYLSLRILDPSVGTGVFLARVFDQIADRVPEFSKAAEDPCGSVTEHIPLGQNPHDAISPATTGQTAVRMRILEQCLYGVDLDAIAVEVATSVLLAKASGGLASAGASIPNLRAGNALMGSAGTSHHELGPAACDMAHARAFFGRGVPEPQAVAEWARSKGLVHWPLEFPEVFSQRRGGFDAVVGNPPYEILSVRESGISERRRDQSYYRKTYKTCTGKINTYRLMIERGLDLLGDGGVLGFIVPATLLADSTSADLRKLILDQSEILRAVVIPESARVFDGVTQALLILVVRKGGKTNAISPAYWDGSGEIPVTGGVRISRHVIARSDNRVPLVKSHWETELLESLARHPTFAGNGDIPPVGEVHQGEINLTTERGLITDHPTDYPLIRGEHVYPFRLSHPTPGRKRLDWALPEALAIRRAGKKWGGDDWARPSQARKRSRAGLPPWEERRIVVGRVVNMATERRLKAALVPPGCFLGDMTNSIGHITVPVEYLLGLLNSKLLNWRLKATSTNNYVSAREIQFLPIVRPSAKTVPEAVTRFGLALLERLAEDPPYSIEDALGMLRISLAPFLSEYRCGLLPPMIAELVTRIPSSDRPPSPSIVDRFLPLLDAMVVLLYDIEGHALAFAR